MLYHRRKVVIFKSEWIYMIYIYIIYTNLEIQTNILFFCWGEGWSVENLGEFGDGNDIFEKWCPGYVWRIFLLSESS